MKITNKWIRDNKPCKEALDLWDKKERDPLKILDLLIKNKKYDWANWYIVRVMNYKQYVSYAVFAAEQFIDIYEKKYVDDIRPRNAIETVKRCIDNPSKENKAAADAAANATAHTMRPVAYAAYAAAYSRMEAVVEAVDAAVGAAAEGEPLKIKILNYGIRLMEEK